MIAKEICERVLQKAASTGADYAEIFAENAQKGLSLLKDKEGTAIAAPVVTLVDDPFYEGNVMPMPFDAEGSPTRRKNVIETAYCVRCCTICAPLLRQAGPPQAMRPSTTMTPRWAFSLSPCIWSMAS